MTQTPREAAEAKIAALQWASKALRSLGTWDAVKAIDERIAALAALPAPSEPTAEGQDELRRQLWNMTQLATERHAERDQARADLARMKAAMEEARQLIFDDCADDARIYLAAALKGTSP